MLSVTQNLQARASLYKRVRSYFDKTGVLEVSTPVLSFAGNTDPAIESFSAGYIGAGSEATMYLHTSPEFFMKRLLCAGSGSIYQIARVFRQGEQGRFHNPEFAMLEWYRLDFDYRQLMRDVQELIFSLTDKQLPVSCITYRELFQSIAIDPFNCDEEQLRQKAVSCGIDLFDTQSLDIDSWLDLLMTHVLEPAMDKAALTFVYDYPVSQASLAKIRDAQIPVAERFELYFGGMEMANGFSELTDAAQQRWRFDNDNKLRAVRGQKPVPPDEHFLQALQNGMPDCSGVALGLDRLLMILQQQQSISDVTEFAWQSV